MGQISGKVYIPKEIGCINKSSHSCGLSIGRTMYKEHIIDK